MSRSNHSLKNVLNLGVIQVRWRPAMCLWFVGTLSFLFLLQASLGVFVKINVGRTDDLVHNALHFFTGVMGFMMILGKDKYLKSQRFAYGFGLFYIGLGLMGWVWSNPFGVLPLGISDHIFHIIIGLISLGVGIVTTLFPR
jgi:hypothetical protein